MHKILGGALLTLLLAVVSGCASSDGMSQAVSGPPANAAGKWSGWAGMGAVAAPVSLSLTQNGGTVTGNIQVGGAPDLSGPVTGTVQGNLLSLSLQTGRSLTPMTVKPDQITGVIGPGPVTLRRAN